MRIRKLLCLWLKTRPYWIGVILIGGFWLRWPGTNPERSLWIDEFASMWMTHPDGAEYVKVICTENQSCTVTAWWTSLKVFQLSNALIHTGSLRMVRVPFLISGLLAIFLAWRIGRKLKSWLLAVIFSTLIACSPFMIYWQNCIRQYSLIVLFFLAIIVACEGWYRARHWGYFLLVLLFSALGALNTLGAIPLLGISGIYLIFSCLYLIINRRNAFLRQFFQRWLPQCICLAAVCFIVYYQARGADRIFPPKDKKPPKDQFIKPDLSNELIKICKDFKLAYLNRDLSPAPLFRLPARNGIYADLLGGFFRGSFISGNLSLIFLILMLIGSVWLARRSPALLAVSYSLMIGLCVLLASNAGREGWPALSERYYIVPAACLFLLIAAGLAGTLETIIGLSFFRYRREAAATIMLCGLGVSGWLIWLTAPAVKTKLRKEPQTWNDVYRDAQAQYPEGALLHGVEPVTLRTLRDLQVFGMGKAGTRFSWTSPMRAKISDYYTGFHSLDLALLEQTNTCAGLYLFYPAYWPNGMNPLANEVTAKYRLNPRYSLPTMGLFHTLMYDLKDNLFITRGHATFPLMQRFARRSLSPEQLGSEFEFKLNIEVPGLYEMKVYSPKGNPIIQAAFNGSPLKINIDSNSARAPVKWDDLTSSLPEAFLPDPDLVARMESPPAYECDVNVALLNYFYAPMTSTSLRLKFKSDIGALRPIIQFKLMEEGWRKTVPLYDTGMVDWWVDQEKIHIAPVLLLRENLTHGSIIQLSLDFPENQNPRKWGTVLGRPRRGARLFYAGDRVLPNPIVLGRTAIQHLIGKRLALLLWPDAKLLASIQIKQPGFIPKGAINLCYVVLEVQNGKLNVRFEPPDKL